MNRSSRQRPLSFIVGDTRLCGTLSLPSKQTIQTRAVLLLSGSGPQDRDQCIAGQRPFLRLANTLTDAGLCVFRWDDRGVGKSDGDYQQVSADTLVTDIGGAMEAVSQATGIRQFLLLGHSQGTLIAARAAHRFPHRTAGLLLLAPMLTHGRVGLLEQHVAICSAQGWSDVAINQSVAAKEVAFDLLISAQNRIDGGEKADGVYRDLRAALANWATGGQLRSEFTDKQWEAVELAVDDLREWEWRFLLSVDPLADLNHLHCPIYALLAEHDCQVPLASNLALWNTHFGTKSNATIEVLQGHNHLFQRCDAEHSFAYKNLGDAPSDEALQAITRATVVTGR